MNLAPGGDKEQQLRPLLSALNDDDPFSGAESVEVRSRDWRDKEKDSCFIRIRSNYSQHKHVCSTTTQPHK